MPDKWREDPIFIAQFESMESPGFADEITCDSIVAQARSLSEDAQVVLVVRIARLVSTNAIVRALECLEVL